MAYIPPDAATRARMIEQVRFNDAGLIAAVAQQHDTAEVLMLAWMNADALDETLRTGRVFIFHAVAGHCGARGKRRDRCRLWWMHGSTATVTQSSCWSVSYTHLTLPTILLV